MGRNERVKDFVVEWRSGLFADERGIAVGFEKSQKRVSDEGDMWASWGAAVLRPYMG
jgi:hypothetical protein